MPERERQRWIAYFSLHPMPDPMRDAAQICAVIANTNRSSGSRARTVDDFLPTVGPKKKRKMSTEEMLSNFRSATAGCK